MRKLLVIIAVSLLAACGGTADESESTSSGFNNSATSQISEIDIDIIYENENLRVHDTKIRSRIDDAYVCLLYTSPSPRDKRQSRMPSSA